MTTQEGTMSNLTADLLAAWGCPAGYRSPRAKWSSVVTGHRGKRRAVSAAANWYPEMDDALAEMVDAHDTAALRAWADSDAWERIAVETSDDGDPGTYPEDVRESLNDLADAIEADDAS